MKYICVVSLIIGLSFCSLSIAQGLEPNTNDHTSSNAEIGDNTDREIDDTDIHSISADHDIDYDLENRLLDAISVLKGERVNMEDVVQIESILREAKQNPTESEQDFELRIMDAVSDIIGHRVNMEEALQIEAAMNSTDIHSISADRDIDYDLENRLLDAISVLKGERVNMEDVVQIESILREAKQNPTESEQDFELRIMDAVSDIIGHRVNMEEALQIEAAMQDSVSKEEE